MFRLTRMTRRPEPGHARLRLVVGILLLVLAMGLIAPIAVSTIVGQSLPLPVLEQPSAGRHQPEIRQHISAARTLFMEGLFRWK